MVIFCKLWNNIFFMYPSALFYHCYTIVEYYKISLTKIHKYCYVYFELCSFNIVIYLWNICFIIHNAIPVYLLYTVTKSINTLYLWYCIQKHFCLFMTVGIYNWLFNWQFLSFSIFVFNSGMAKRVI